MPLFLLPIFFPIASGAFLLIWPSRWVVVRRKKETPRQRRKIRLLTGALISLTAILSIATAFIGTDKPYILFYLTRRLPLQFYLDELGRLFLPVISVIWVLVSFFAFEYMKKEGREKRCYGFLLLLYGTMNGLCFAGNLVTFYLFYELMTLASLPLVLHSQTKEAVIAGLKYLFFSFAGAYMVLFGLFCLPRFCLSNTLTFGAGGILDSSLTQGHETLLLVTAFFMILGFGVKAGMFPMHSWLTAAHPVAPAPISALLSGLVVKGGVLGIIRVVYYLFGAAFLRGTWVQYSWLVLTLITVLMGSMLAYLEKNFKKRLAYSTVSQVSYILFGFALMERTAFTGAVLHMIFHAIIKSALFLTAGAIIYQTGKKKVDEYRGIGKQMPVTLWCYTFAALALIGIPPASGFISKWYLALGSLQSGIRVFAYLGPVVLLVSALLTAGYLLPITIHGFLPGNDFDYASLEKKEPSRFMTVPLLILAVLCVGLGVLPGGLAGTASGIASAVMRVVG